MKDGEHDDFVALLANLIDDDVRPLDQLIRPRIEADTAHSSETGREEQFELAKNPIKQPLRCPAVVFGNPIEDVLKIAEGIFLEDEPHSPKRVRRFRASVSDTYFGFFLVRRRRNSASCSSFSR